MLVQKPLVTNSFPVISGACFLGMHSVSRGLSLESSPNSVQNGLGEGKDPKIRGMLSEMSPAWDVTGHLEHRKFHILTVWMGDTMKQ